MNDMDFYVPQISFVVHRPPNKAWRMNRLCYEDEYVVVIALDGSAVFSLSDGDLCVEKDDVVIFSPGTARSGRAMPQSPWEYVSIKFKLEYNEDSRDFFSQPYLHFHNATAILRNKFVDVANEWEGRRPLHHVKCKYLVQSILYDLVFSSLPQNNVLHRSKLECACDFIQKNLTDEIDLRALSEAIGLSPSYFRKLFKEAYGISPMQYITKLRIATARDLLASGEFNVTEAAQMSGFNDIYYFSTVFKKETGLPPSRLLRSSKGQ